MSERCVGTLALSTGRFISQKGGIVEEIIVPPNPRPHANFQIFTKNHKQTHCFKLSGAGCTRTVSGWTCSICCPRKGHSFYVTNFF